jgi:hypothetical protein
MDNFQTETQLEDRMDAFNEDTNERKIRSILKWYFRNEDEEVITKKTWLGELNLLNNFNAENIGHIWCVRPKLVKKKTMG